MISSCSKCDLQKGTILKGKEWIPESAPPGTGGSSRGDGGGARNRAGGERSGPQEGSRVAPRGCFSALLCLLPPPRAHMRACTHTHTHTHTESLAREKGWSGFPSCRPERAHILASPRTVYPGESVPGTPATPGTHLPPGSTPTPTSWSRAG